MLELQLSFAETFVGIVILLNRLTAHPLVMGPCANAFTECIREFQKHGCSLSSTALPLIIVGLQLTLQPESIVSLPIVRVWQPEWSLCGMSALCAHYVGGRQAEHTWKSSLRHWSAHFVALQLKDALWTGAWTVLLFFTKESCHKRVAGRLGSFVNDAVYGREMQGS